MYLFMLLHTLLALSDTGSAQEYLNHPQRLLGGMVIGRADVSSPAQVQHKGNFVLVNQCYYDIYIRETWTAYEGPLIQIPARSPYRREFVTSYPLPSNHACIDNCGVTYKITKGPEQHGGIGGNLLQFEYSSKLGIFYYDISFVDCAKDLAYRWGDASNCPSWAEGIQIQGPSNFGCETLECHPYETCIYDRAGAYFIDEPNPKWQLRDPVRTCDRYGQGLEVYFRTCSGSPDL